MKTVKEKADDLEESFFEQIYPISEVNLRYRFYKEFHKVNNPNDYRIRAARNCAIEHCVKTIKLLEEIKYDKGLTKFDLKNYTLEESLSEYTEIRDELLYR